MNRRDEGNKLNENVTTGCDLERIEIQLLLEGIYRYYGFDFRNYSFSSIRRRIRYRMQIEKLNSVTSLLDRLLHDSTMMEKLFSDFSINVTEMFRDPSFFKMFRQKVIPILRMYPTVRIWHAGCSTGEEAYSMAILLHEEGLAKRTQIYATDMNEAVIDKAKAGTLPINKMKLYTSNYVSAGGIREFSEYYKVDNRVVHLHPYLTDMITFAQHNLVTDSSFNEFHVIICRNVLIYFDQELQNRVHQLIYESLAPSGFLGLGQKEKLCYTAVDRLYNVVNESERIYRKL